MDARHHANITTGREFRESLRAGPYAWPGGYALALVMSDGELLCFDCARDEGAQIIRAIRMQSRCGWRAVGVTSLEGAECSEYCAHCGKVIFDAEE